MNNQEAISYFLSFLTILVHRAGGRLEIKGLKQYSGTNLELGMEIDLPNDRVILTVKERVIEKKRLL